MKRINASAIVDPIENAAGKWRVEVTGQEPYAITCIYFLNGKTEKDAAFEGIRRFCEEMENMNLEIL